MPPGLKLDAAFTLLTIANNLEDPAGVKNLADAVETETTAISQWLLESDSVFALLLGPDGTIRARNRAARRIFPDSAEEKTETSIWDYLVCADTTDLRRRLLDFTETIKAPFLLNLTDGQQNQMTAEVTIIPCRGASVMIGAQEHQHDARFQNESFKLTDHLALMMRDASQKNRELNATNAKVTELSQTDGLTGLANRRSLDEAMLREVARAARTGKSLSVILADLDHFKSINDNFGHNTGDQVLIRAAAVFGTSLRPYDLAARYGGEEFLLLLPGATSEAASAISDRIRNEISKLIIPGCLQPITASFGVASWAGGETPGALIARADAALYVAKNAGRNRVEVAAGVEA
jgi:diguanylate cyclase (GGDEF)-like protein